MIIDKKLWDDMRHTLSGISMPLVSHQQVQQLLNHVEQVSSSANPAVYSGNNAPADLRKANGEAHDEVALP